MTESFRRNGVCNRNEASLQMHIHRRRASRKGWPSFPLAAEAAGQDGLPRSGSDSNWESNSLAAGVAWLHPLFEREIATGGAGGSVSVTYKDVSVLRWRGCMRPAGHGGPALPQSRARVEFADTAEGVVVSLQHLTFDSGLLTLGSGLRAGYTRLRKRGLANSSRPTAVRKRPVKSTAMMTMGGTHHHHQPLMMAAL